MLISFLLFCSSTFSTFARAEDSPFKFEVHGIVGASFYVQSNPDFFLNGQGPLLLRAQNNSPTSGFDVRQTRLNFTITGPMLFTDVTPRAVIEADFFGLDSPGSYGEVSVLQRLRLAYLELKRGNTTIRMGQDWELFFINSPTSLGHITYPVAWFAGMIGWREPGFALYQQFALDAKSNIESAVQIIKSDWVNPYGFNNSAASIQNLDAGQLSGYPGVEARVKWTNETSTAYLAGHWNRVMGSRASNSVFTGTTSPVYANRDWDVAAAKVGGRTTFQNFTFIGEGYAGKNTAPLIGEEATFYTEHDVREWGAWAQVGYNFTSEWSFWAMYGVARSSRDDVVANAGGPYANTVFGGIFQYRVSTFGFGPEIYHVQTKSTLASGTGASDGVMDGMQYMLSGMYFF